MGISVIVDDDLINIPIPWPSSAEKYGAIAQAKSTGAGAGSSSAATVELQEKLAALKSRFQKVLANNDTVPELEKMERYEFEIDRAMVAKAKEAADAEAEALKAQVLPG
jgi:hypothetical protein